MGPQSWDTGDNSKADERPCCKVITTNEGVRSGKKVGSAGMKGASRRRARKAGHLGYRRSKDVETRTAKGLSNWEEA